jgi:hypothetical protein
VPDNRVRSRRLRAGYDDFVIDAEAPAYMRERAVA